MKKIVCLLSFLILTSSLFAVSPLHDEAKAKGRLQYVVIVDDTDDYEKAVQAEIDKATANGYTLTQVAGIGHVLIFSKR